MKILIAMDSMKESLSSAECAEAVKEGAEEALDGASFETAVISDGGEGLTEALVTPLGGTVKTIKVRGPLGETAEARYGILKDGTAVIEAAEACGLSLVPKEKRNPMKTSTYGVGEMIASAMKDGAEKFIIGLGGSSTNDCGIGLLSALGFSFKDKDGKEIPPHGAEALPRIKTISDENVLPGLRKCSFRVACDVKNPLLGKTGCSFVFAPQKGASEDDVILMDGLIKDFSEKAKGFTGKDAADTPGAGAAGGLGFAFLSFLNSSLVPGIDLILETLGTEEKIKNCDIAVTGEGRLDSQSAMGKAPSGVAALAKKYGKPVIAFCGCASDDAELCNGAGIDAFFPILQRPMTQEEAMDRKNAYANLKKTANQAFRLINTIMKEKNNDKL